MVADAESPTRHSSKKYILAVALAAYAGLNTAGLRAQGNAVVIQQHVSTNRLSAVVIDSAGVAIPGAQVSLFKCPKGEFKGYLSFVPIVETLTDQQGRFSLRWPSERVCLQVKSLGMDLLQMEVLHRSSAGELHVKLVPGT